MNTQHNIEDRLWDYIDGSGSVEENAFVEQLIATQEEWRKKYHELLDIHQLMSSSLELDEPSLRFAQNVMEEITRSKIAPATKSYIDKKIIYGIGIFFLVMIVGFFIYGLGQVNWAQSDSTYGISVTKWIDKGDYMKFFNNTYTNIFMMVNVVMGLMLLDMYLGKKRKKLNEKQS